MFLSRGGFLATPLGWGELSWEQAGLPALAEPYQQPETSLTPWTCSFWTSALVDTLKPVKILSTEPNEVIPLLWELPGGLRI